MVSINTLLIWVELQKVKAEIVKVIGQGGYYLFIVCSTKKVY